MVTVAYIKKFETVDHTDQVILYIKLNVVITYYEISTIKSGKLQKLVLTSEYEIF
jgi:hypothetical protein